MARSAAEASARFLVDDFLWEVQRAYELYVVTAPKLTSLALERRAGFFEPVRLFFCWSDFLGALYLGNTKAGTMTRITTWLSYPMEAVRRGYKAHAKKLHLQYRNQLIHGGGYGQHAYSVCPEDEPSHLARGISGGIQLVIPCLLTDLDRAVKHYAQWLTSNPAAKPPRCGTIEALNKALQEFSR